jgi:hypothetical protein
MKDGIMRVRRLRTWASGRHWFRSFVTPSAITPTNLRALNDADKLELLAIVTSSTSAPLCERQAVPSACPTISPTRDHY